MKTRILKKQLALGIVLGLLLNLSVFSNNLDIRAATYSISGVYVMSADHNGILAGLVVEGTDSASLEYAWYACGDNENWILVQDWTLGNEWLCWTPEVGGDYVLVGKARVPGDDSTIQEAVATVACHPYIKGKCQMPYTGGGGGFLIGVESYTNPNQEYRYEMLILDCTLLAEGKDAWIYTTGQMTVSEGCALWTIWQPVYGYYWTLFRVYDKNGKMIDQECYGFENTNLEYIQPSDPTVPTEPTEPTEPTDPSVPENPTEELTYEDYTYELIPLLEPFNEMFYLKTDNPNISRLRFVDEESKYYTESTEEYDYLSQDGTAIYSDVKYEVDYETREFNGEKYDAYVGRVNGGYILKCQNKGNDGGEFILYVDQGQRWNGTEYEDYIEKTDIKVSCPDLIDYCDYLIQNYTSEGKSLFDNLSDVHDMLWDNSIYPRNVALDGTEMSDTEKYPYLYAYSYPEMSLGAETCIYPEKSYLVNELYPFTLNSSSFPGTMRVIAKRLEPDCVVSAGPIHSYIEVEYNGESHDYGGAGQGGTAPLYESDITNFFKFDGSKTDFAKELTLEKLSAVAWEYVSLAGQKAAPIGSTLNGAGFYEAIGTGSWLRIHGEITNTETGDKYPVYSYAYTWEEWNYHYENDPFYPEDVWIDGRYVNKYNYFEPGATFDEHPTAYILIRAFTYTDAYNDVYTEDIKFKYDETKDAWYAINLTGDILINVNQTKYDYPEEFILTREEVEAMDVDRNTNIMPENGLIYDGTVEPGTPFNN